MLVVYVHWGGGEVGARSKSSLKARNGPSSGQDFEGADRHAGTYICQRPCSSSSIDAWCPGCDVLVATFVVSCRERQTTIEERLGTAACIQRRAAAAAGGKEQRSWQPRNWVEGMEGRVVEE